jgi:hypothetical protein
MNMPYGVPGTRELPNVVGYAPRAVPGMGYTMPDGAPLGYGTPGGFVLSESAATYPNFYPPFRTGMGANARGPAFPSGIAPGYGSTAQGAIAKSFPQGSWFRKISAAAAYEASQQATRQAPVSGGSGSQPFGATTGMGYGAPYGITLRKQPQTQCDKWENELISARAGQGKGIFGLFGGKGLFGNRISVLEKKMDKWCTRAAQEQAQAEQASAFAASLTPGYEDPAMAAAMSAPAPAPDNTMLFVGLAALLALGGGGVYLATRKK